jgi:hypothetical protein
MQSDLGGLRPIERRMLRLAEQGVPAADIAWRFRRTPRTVRQVISLCDRPASPAPVRQDPLRPIERRVMRWRDAGFDFDELAFRFRRGPAFLRQVEDLARLKLARADAG